MNIKKISLLCALLGAFVLIVVLLPPGMLSLDTLKIHQQTLLDRVEQAPLQSALIYFAVYVLVSALSIPGAALLTLLGGAIFNLWEATLLVSLASTLGATLAMLVSRYLLRDWVQRRFAAQMNTIDVGMVRDGARYLFALRLMPLFPFFLVNLLMGLTRIQVRHYWWVSQLAMLPATVIYLNAGRELGKLTTLRDILSPGLLFAFTLLGLLPLVTRWLFSRYIPSIKK
ncbi:MULTISPECIES: TVP38/TMEM64 family protein [Enterobacter cloacae complex]|uniref:TVP38/TMEM64 family protein n=1 Tax=Enterobacter cloacae complex TaxID=354276 RepID=UPI0007A7645B|nr:MULTISPECIES: TVP38/TMEM64 family protein [Enterobacter cloacae complex]EKX4570402.1 TVP38/TMEM64 family protein [Enterobacter hormaechei]EKX8280725.1 TVP38/TMEM64 family protein [Enterobacter hormaechei]EKZ1674127.1 TVP38/TMEM64 family protein [Enterobacter hormaechei]EKZ9442536.1 TVP38/TMEM64 family protein [Enterobacter hormaechei]ELJ2087724.1 TVP38/TMEM64 family protein [Enterobacter hormaechei]